jgi:hypothetical protein
LIGVIVVFNASGDSDGTVENPIVMPEPGEGTGVGQANGADEAGEAPAPEPFAPGDPPSQ